MLSRILPAGRTPLGTTSDARLAAGRQVLLEVVLRGLEKDLEGEVDRAATLDEAHRECRSTSCEAASTAADSRS